MGVPRDFGNFYNHPSLYVDPAFCKTHSCDVYLLHWDLKLNLIFPFLINVALSKPYSLFS